MSSAALGTADSDPKSASRTSPRRWRVVAALPPTPAVDIVLPVHNEEADLARSVRRLHAYLTHEFPFSARITIADGASTDGTLKIAWELAADLHHVRLLRINENRRGRTLAAAWLTSDADVVAQMDVGQTSCLSGLLPLIAPIMSGLSDVSIAGQSAADGRSRKGEAMESLRVLLARLKPVVFIRDAHVQIRALRADVARRILPTVQNRDWLFDAEVLERAERAGFRIHGLQTV